LRLWSEHLGLPEDEIAGDPTDVIDGLWIPIARRTGVVVLIILVSQLLGEHEADGALSISRMVQQLRAIIYWRAAH
jgi:hypothetical protein